MGREALEPGTAKCKKCEDRNREKRQFNYKGKMQVRREREGVGIKNENIIGRSIRY